MDFKGEIVYNMSLCTTLAEYYNYVLCATFFPFYNRKYIFFM